MGTGAGVGVGDEPVEGDPLVEVSAVGEAVADEPVVEVWLAPEDGVSMVPPALPARSQPLSAMLRSITSSNAVNNGKMRVGIGVGAWRMEGILSQPAVVREGVCGRREVPSVARSLPVSAER